MHILINNQSAEVPEGSSLYSIVSERLGTAPRGIAVAVNGSVIAAAAQAACILQPGDNILIIKATQGG